MVYDILIVGGGVAGLKAAICAHQSGLKCAIVEGSDNLGGNVKGLYKLFPDYVDSSEVLGRLTKELEQSSAEVFYNEKVVKIDTDNRVVTTNSGRTFQGKTIIIATGYSLFDATLKQEYGYGVFDNVYTSYEFESMLRSGDIKTKDGRTPEKIAFLHCVGSRDEKVMQNHCSKVCCVTAVKQAIEVKQLLPQSKAYCFYMDIRMFGAGYEEMYRTAQQEYQIHFIRGRVSESSENMDSTVVLKAEDTLIGKPIRLSVDIVVLMIGMCAQNKSVAEDGGLELYKSGFLKPQNSVDLSVYSQKDGIFYAGCASAPKNIYESTNDATHAVSAAHKFLIKEGKV